MSLHTKSIQQGLYFAWFLKCATTKTKIFNYVVLLNNKVCDIFIIGIAIKFHKCYVIMRYLSNLCSVIK
jgi:uncharacterized protein YjfI (DUF2170 family)